MIDSFINAQDIQHSTFQHAVYSLISATYTHCNILQFSDHQHYKEPLRIVKVRNYSALL